MQIYPLAELAGPATHLSFTLTLADGRMIATLADAASFSDGLTKQERGTAHWRIAARMLDVAKKEPAYSKAATISLQSALLLQGLIDQVKYARHE